MTWLSRNVPFPVMLATPIRTRRTAADAWLERVNPLQGLTIRQAQGIFDAARGRGSALLQRIYAEIEAADPVLLTCVERRAAALAGMGWRVRAHTGAADAVLADEQRDALTRAADAIENLDEAVEHLSLAWFRGYSHVLPVWGEDGAVREIALLDSWHFLRAPDGRWLWNPECRMDEAGLRPVGGEERLVSIARRRAIDYPALAIYIRHALAERDWGRFLERYGIPPVDAVMSPDATMANRADYLEAAERARDGLPVVWPGGSQISRAEGSRGQDPFSAFVRHQEELIVLMATGGTLTSLAEAGSGTLAGGAQMDVWEQIVRRDAQLIGAALQRGLFARALEARFPGRPVCASFELGTEAEPSPSEVFELAAKARAAGYVVAQPELEEATGYRLAPEAGSGGGFGGFGGFAAGMPAGTPLQSVAKPLQNAASAPDDETPAPEDGTPQNASYAVLGDLAESLATDMSPAAERVAALLEMPEAERAAAAAALLEDLPGLLPDGRFAPDGTGDRTGGMDADGRAGYTDDNRKAVGKTGDWKSLGLPAGRDVPPDPPTPKVQIATAKERLAKGETVTNPLGDTLALDARTLKHINKKGRTEFEVKNRLQELDAAKITLERPHEIWTSDGGETRKYVRFEEVAGGGKVINAVEESQYHVMSWHSNTIRLDYYREGTLLYVRGK